MKKSIRERIDRARCNPANIREVRRQSAQRAWRENEETYRRCIAEREERRRARADAGHAELVDPDYCEPKDGTTPYPHEPGYHLTVNGETLVFVDYAAALTKFVEVLNGALETNLAVKVDLVGPDVTMGFLFELIHAPVGLPKPE